MIEIVGRGRLGRLFHEPQVIPALILLRRNWRLITPHHLREMAGMKVTFLKLHHSQIAQAISNPLLERCRHLSEERLENAAACLPIIGAVMI
jgi:hypothetical protein